jgi:DNA-binding NtrC family response regulator
LLVVEDEVTVASVLRDALQDFGYSVKIAVTGAEALRLVPIYRPDVVLLDLWLPEMRGDEVFAELRRLHPSLPVIMVTGNQDLEIARALLRAGAFDYVPKPFDLTVLERAVAAAVAFGTRADPSV